MFIIDGVLNNRSSQLVAIANKGFSITHYEKSENVPILYSSHVILIKDPSYRLKEKKYVLEGWMTDYAKTVYL